MINLWDGKTSFMGELETEEQLEHYLKHFYHLFKEGPKVHAKHKHTLNRVLRKTKLSDRWKDERS